MKKQTFALRTEHFFWGLIVLLAVAYIQELVKREGIKAADWTANEIDSRW